MGFKLTTCKETAIRAFIHEWIKDQTLYCNHCGNIYVPAPEGCVEESCCDRMQIGKNSDFLYGLIMENKRIRETRSNKFASNKDKTFRLGISLTPRLLHDLEQYSMNTLKEPFLKDKNEMDDFMRSFPEFRCCSEV